MVPTCLIVFSVLLSCLAICPCMAQAEAPWLNIRSFGAAGDGLADDTDAFERALTAGREQSLPVLAPRGSYRLTRPLVLRNQALIGDNPGGWPADGMPMAVLRIEHTSGPGIVMQEFASLQGLAVCYPEGTVFPEDGAPPAISLAGQGPTISQVRLQYPYDGIITAPGAAPGRARMSDIFIVAPRHDGVYLTRSYDVSQLRSIEVWCNGGMSTGAGFRLGRNDDCQLSDLFAFQCQAGFLFETDEAEGGGVFYGSLSDCSTDACSLGYVVRGDHRINISNSDLIDHHTSLEIDGEKASVRVTGCQIQTNGAPAVRAVGCANLSITNCIFMRAFNADFYFIDAAACGSLTVSSCQFRDSSQGVRLGPGVERAVVAHNVFEALDKPAIVDEMLPTAKRILEPNITM